MPNNSHPELCLTCDGKGYLWKHGKIISRRDGSEVAHTYAKGDACLTCFGTGRQPLISLPVKRAAINFAFVAPVVFGLFYLYFHL